MNLSIFQSYSLLLSSEPKGHKNVSFLYSQGFHRWNKHRECWIQNFRSYSPEYDRNIILEYSVTRKVRRIYRIFIVNVFIDKINTRQVKSDLTGWIVFVDWKILRFCAAKHWIAKIILLAAASWNIVFFPSNKGL